MRIFKKLFCSAICGSLFILFSIPSAWATHQAQVNDLTSGTQIISSTGIVIDPGHPIGFLLPHCHSSCDAALGHADPNPDPNGAGHGFTFLIFHSSPPPPPPPATNNLFPQTGRDQVALTGGDFKINVPRHLRKDLEGLFNEGSQGTDPTKNETMGSNPGFLKNILNGVGTGSADNLFAMACDSGGGGCDIFSDGFESGDLSGIFEGSSTSFENNQAGVVSGGLFFDRAAIDEFYFDDGTQEEIAHYEKTGEFPKWFRDKYGKGEDGLPQIPLSDQGTGEFGDLKIPAPIVNSTLTEGDPEELLNQGIDVSDAGQPDSETETPVKEKPDNEKPGLQDKSFVSRVIPQEEPSPGKFDNAISFLILGGFGFELDNLKGDASKAKIRSAGNSKEANDAMDSLIKGRTVTKEQRKKARNLIQQDKEKAQQKAGQKGTSTKSTQTSKGNVSSFDQIESVVPELAGLVVL